MLVINAILMFAAIAFACWLVWSYRYQLSNVLGLCFSGGQSLLFAIGFICLEALKSVVLAAFVGGIFGLIFYLAGATDQITKTVGIVVAGLIFTILMLKALQENLNNLRWTMRHEVRNRYRKR
ncbi:MAG TPA: hypothetical protein DCY91_06055 [Cyanobacteria bacterium UBA11370]|nr:hypothetical protein [Cyanobacteria bacterium UBA11370]HBY76006.1 hypothetical protein [Cyanobacteria bacterium UBA11148]